MVTVFNIATVYTIFTDFHHEISTNTMNVSNSLLCVATMQDHMTTDAC